MNSQDLELTINRRSIAHAFNDNRFIEITNALRNPQDLSLLLFDVKQLNYIVKLPGDKPSGNHFHKTKIEEIVLLEGDLLLHLQDPSTRERYDTLLKQGEIVTLEPEIAHTLILPQHVQIARYLEFANLPFDQSNPTNDCYPYKII